MAACDVVVWESVNEFSLCWQTYEVKICNKIEKAFQKSIDQHLKIADIDKDIKIDFSSMEEIDKASGDVKPVRRLTFPADSPLATGTTWEWNVGHGRNEQWQSYPADVVHYIETEHNSNNKNMLDLSQKFPELDYTIEFSLMKQINNVTGFQRKIQRYKCKDKYPIENIKPSTPTSHVNQANLPGSSMPTDVEMVSSTPTLKRSFAGSVPSELSSYAKAVLDPPKEDCCICMGSLHDESGFTQGTSGGNSIQAPVVELNKCNHYFHSDCLKAAFNNDAKKASLTCPYCKTIYGIKMGIQPPGTMRDHIIHQSLPGFSCNTIQIQYNFRSGMQTAGQPNPGQRYSAHSFPRTAYLPDNSDGRKILALLKVAWKRRLIFTIGQSVTTGAQNVVTWNEIHHKTEMTNYSAHGYPDPNYFVNVVEELKAQGVTEDDLK